MGMHCPEHSGKIAYVCMIVLRVQFSQDFFVCVCVQEEIVDEMQTRTDFAMNNMAEVNKQVHRPAQFRDF